MKKKILFLTTGILILLMLISVSAQTGMLTQKTQLKNSKSIKLNSNELMAPMRGNRDPVPCTGDILSCEVNLYPVMDSMEIDCTTLDPIIGGEPCTYYMHLMNNGSQQRSINATTHVFDIAGNPFTFHTPTYTRNEKSRTIPETLATFQQEYALTDDDVETCEIVYQGQTLISYECELTGFTDFAEHVNEASEQDNKQRETFIAIKFLTKYKDWDLVKKIKEEYYAKKNISKNKAIKTNKIKIKKAESVRTKIKNTMKKIKLK
ncbi:MAG: hypothetical protein ABIA76_05235 [Candidatus Diapherotrites archaeon]